MPKWTIKCCCDFRGTPPSIWNWTRHYSGGARRLTRTVPSNTAPSLTMISCPLVFQCWLRMFWLVITRLAKLLFVLIAPALPLFAQEHPRAPQQSQSQQLPQTRTGAPQTAMTQATMSDVSDGLKRFISGYSAKSPDNKFHIPFQRKDLGLDLVKVHDDRFSSLGGDKYFACVDMKGKRRQNVRHRFLHGGGGRQTCRDRNFRSQNQRETSLQLETREGGVWKKVPVS